MNHNQLKELFGIDKPVIAMAHFPALPGTPLYDSKMDIGCMIETMKKDVDILLAGGVDGILFCNEADRPYALQADLQDAAVMSRVITELAPHDRPFGVDYLWDTRVQLAVGMATGAAFVRGVFTGVYESDMGLWSPDAAATLRYRRQIGAEGIKMFYNITPEFASYFGTRSVGDRAISAVISSLADVLLVSGMTAGMEPKLDILREVKEAIGEMAPVFLNTGGKADNIQKYLSVADGVIVGSSLKVDGYTWNAVDARRVKEFMEAVKALRNG
jgi:uncharacterized protein